MKKISIIIPVYNNQDSLLELISRINLVEKEIIINQIKFEIIVVNDSSSDNSLDVIRNIKKKIRNDLVIINFSKNYGPNLAAKTGFKYSTGDAHTVLVADLQDPPETLIELINRWLKGEKIIIAERNSRDDPVISAFFSKVFYFFLRILVNKNYPKNGFDLFLIDKKITEYFKNSDKDIYFPIHLMSLGFSYSVVKYHRQKRQAGKSQWSFLKKINATLEIFLVYSSFRISKLILYLGLLIFIAGFLYSIVLLYLAIFHGYRTGGFVTLFLYITVFFGIFISLMGIISMQIYRVLDRASKTDETIIDFIEK